ncbi:MAG TPA: GTP cyclohydrolase II [Candidatus Poseidoniaceae archaeon]|nr:MAG TPA: GTP cyclohydrolase II [Candidatus Poseidoniales archaeon]HIH53641.1 GTP cyclohydrolase II [Candidatus Poseidoniaceae archaeon]
MHFLSIMAITIESTNIDVPAQAQLPTAFGTFTLHAFVDPKTGAEHALLTVGDLASADAPLVRIHSECLTGDAFGSLKCDCGPQLQLAMRAVQDAGVGAVVYLRQEGRGIGLYAKVQAYHLQDLGYDTLDANLALGLPADARTYEMAAAMLKELGVNRVRLMTNNPDKIEQLEKHGINVVSRVEHKAGICSENRDYLQTKVSRMRHILPI